MGTAGRPTIYTPELAEAICELLADDMSERKICLRGDMPDRKTLANWRLRYPDFSAKCARACEARADAIHADMGDIEDRTLSGEIKADVARVVLSSKQWRASKLSVRYSDRMRVGEDGDSPLGKLTDEQIEAKYQALLARRAAQTDA